MDEIIKIIYLFFANPICNCLIEVCLSSKKCHSLIAYYWSSISKLVYKISVFAYILNKSRNEKAEATSFQPQCLKFMLANKRL